MSAAVKALLFCSLAVTGCVSQKEINDHSQIDLSGDIRYFKVMIRNILFDMDNCLYPASSGLCDEMNRRITDFVADLLSSPREEVSRLRKENVKAFGTTLKWLESSYDFSDVDEYNRVIHPDNVEDFLKPSSGLKVMLDNLPCGASVLTNAPAIHAERVLGFLGITLCFDNVLDLGFCGTIGKPHRATYEKALEVCGYEIEQTLFVDDIPEYLVPFKDMGGEVLLV
ncbi:MAG TPA: hypothetical protein DCO79_08020, partial [Spirochaeta sp.]|nr:hypothetical protein [Spirochaeta sp.]